MRRVNNRTVLPFKIGEKAEFGGVVIGVTACEIVDMCNASKEKRKLCRGFYFRVRTPGGEDCDVCGWSEKERKEEN